MDLAEQYLGENRPALAEEMLDTIDEEFLRFDLRARHDLLAARALASQGEFWDAFDDHLRNYAERHRFRPENEQAIALQLELGKLLLERDDGLWPFYDDRDDAVDVLINLLSNNPGHPSGAAALRLIATEEERDERWEIAQLRYEELLSTYPNSEWAPFARYRQAMTTYLQIQGSAYDQAQIRLARNELTSFLQGNAIRPEFAQTARAALKQTEIWLAERELRIADFYRQVGSVPGERQHLGFLLEQFPDAAEAEEARERLTALGSAEPVDGDGTPAEGDL